MTHIVLEYTNYKDEDSIIVTIQREGCTDKLSIEVPLHFSNTFLWCLFVVINVFLGISSIVFITSDIPLVGQLFFIPWCLLMFLAIIYAKTYNIDKKIEKAELKLKKRLPIFEKKKKDKLQKEKDYNDYIEEIIKRHSDAEEAK